MWEGRTVSNGSVTFSPDDKVTSQMLQMGYDPSKGLGKQQTGIIEPICLTLRQLHTGLDIQIYSGGHCFCCRPHYIEISRPSVGGTMASA